MQEEATATPQSRTELTSDDHWLVQCLTLAAFCALAVSQIQGESVFLSLM